MRFPTSTYALFCLLSWTFLPSCGKEPGDRLSMDPLIQHFSRRGLHPVEVSASGDQAMALLSAMRGGATNPGTKVQLSASRTLLLDGHKTRVRIYENPAAAAAALSSLRAFQERQETDAEDQGRPYFSSHFFQKGPFLLEVKGSKLGADLKPKAVECAPGFLDKLEQALESFEPGTPGKE
ncbi:MAG TPA: hypothetical protein ENK02_07380 [Planctomycetes bacterium]|nr:hypothetical protein [Planctomycetota bacterium]